MSMPHPKHHIFVAIDFLKRIGCEVVTWKPMRGRHKLSWSFGKLTAKIDLPASGRADQLIRLARQRIEMWFRSKGLGDALDRAAVLA